MGTAAFREPGVSSEKDAAARCTAAWSNVQVKASGDSAPTWSLSQASLPVGRIAEGPREARGTWWGWGARV